MKIIIKLLFLIGIADLIATMIMCMIGACYALPTDGLLFNTMVICYISSMILISSGVLLVIGTLMFSDEDYF